MRKSLRVIMLMRADFLSQMLQSKANTGGLIFLLRASQNKEGWRVNVRPVALSVCVRKCLCSCVYPNVSLSLCAFFIRVRSKCLQMLVPFAPLTIKGHCRMAVPQRPDLQAVYLYATITGMCNMFYPCGRKLTWRKFFSHKEARTEKYYKQLFCLVLKYVTGHIACEHRHCCWSLSSTFYLL